MCACRFCSDNSIESDPTPMGAFHRTTLIASRSNDCERFIKERLGWRKKIGFSCSSCASREGWTYCHSSKLGPSSPPRVVTSITDRFSSFRGGALQHTVWRAKLMGTRLHSSTFHDGGSVRFPQIRPRRPWKEVEVGKMAKHNELCFSSCSDDVYYHQNGERYWKWPSGLSLFSSRSPSATPAMMMTS